MEAKLVQQLAYREQAPLFCIFLDLEKEYESMYRGRFLEILKVGGLQGGTTGTEVDPTVLGVWGDGVQGKRVLWAGVQGRQGGDPRGGPLAKGL